MRPAFIKADKDALRRILLSDAVQDFCMSYAEEIVGVAQSSAPVGADKDRHAGDYANSIKATPMRSPERAWARVEADVPYAMKIQANTGHLMNSLDAVRRPGG